MSSKYDKEIAISHEEEGTYHRREVSNCAPTSGAKATTTQHSERYVIPESRSPATRSKWRSNGVTSKQLDKSDDDGDNYDEWTVSKRKVNHKTRQVETRVSRQLLVEDGKVIADSGPQVTTRIKEDNKVEESEKEKAPKSRRGFEALENAPESLEASSGRVLGEKKQIQRVSREVREENMQYHDERFNELSGRDVHRRAIKAPHELMSIHDEHERHSSGSTPRGKMVHYSNKGKKYQDTDEILEVAKLAIDGSVTKEVKHTRHHEEFSDDEKPDEKGEAEELRRKPIVERSSRRHVDCVNDFDDMDVPLGAGAGADEGAQRHKHSAGVSSSARNRERSNEPFPRYEIDPLLDSLREEDFKVHTNVAPARGRQVEQLSVVRRRGTSSSSSSSSDEGRERQARRAHANQSGSHATRAPPVEIPEEYRVHKQRLMSSKSSGSGRRSESPSTRQVPQQQQQQQQHKSISRPAGARREDASVQARLTDEEEELNAHEKTTRYLQRQSTPNSSRHYYYGEQKQNRPAKSGRRESVTSSSESSLDEIARRKQGAQSRDSGFRSPAQRAQTPSSQIYSASAKASKHRAAPTSPTPSAGQRSVKTTTTTMSAGLKERPLSPVHLSSDDEVAARRPQRPLRAAKQQQQQQQQKGAKAKKQPKQQRETKHYSTKAAAELANSNDENNDQTLARSRMASVDYRRRQRQNSIDSISVSSLKGPNATKIKVPYRKLSEIEREDGRTVGDQGDSHCNMSNDTIENLSRRLANITRTSEPGQSSMDHFDYKTVVANVLPSGQPGQHQKIIGVYNMQLIEQSTPFATNLELSSCSKQASDSGIEANASKCDNNNETNFNLNEFNFKYRAVPALVEPNVLLCSQTSRQEQDDDRMSQVSSCSLQSSKTYNVGKVLEELETRHQEEVATNGSERASKTNGIESLNQLSSKNPAWIFDPRDGSSTAIAPPPKQEKPPTPEVQTEELVQAPGGRSYYLELVDDNISNKDKQPEESRGSLYSRWNSQGALEARDSSSSGAFINWSSPRATVSTKAVVPNQNKTIHLCANKQESRIDSNKPIKTMDRPYRKQLPYNGKSMLSSPSSSIAFGNRSKSSSCLLSVTKPSKYSIYGGFRKPDEASKPVPRLSYSRAIGPRSQRQIDAHPKVPSRYLKMK